MGKKITIYSTPTCPWCKRAKDFLSQHKVPFRDINVAVDHQAAQEMVRKSGQMGVPVIDIEGKIIVGFDKDAIARELGLEGKV